MIVAGLVDGEFGFGPRMVLRRFNTDGSPDTSFGTNGATETDFFASQNECLGHRDSGRRQDHHPGRIGSSKHGPRPADADRPLHGIGCWDAGFASGGKFVSAAFTFRDVVGDPYRRTTSLLIQPNGSILAAGTNENNDVADLQMVRLTSACGARPNFRRRRRNRHGRHRRVRAGSRIPASRQWQDLRPRHSLRRRADLRALLQQRRHAVGQRRLTSKPRASSSTGPATSCFWTTAASSSPGELPAG